jgi:hypothetical protein
MQIPDEFYDFCLYLHQDSFDVYGTDPKDTADAMGEFLTDIHSLKSGVHFTLRWKDEREYQLGKSFLNELLADTPQLSAQPSDKVPTFYLEDDRFIDALFEFRRKLREAEGR